MEHPQLKGVVIISLPPADNPSAGKTINAFTFSDDHQQYTDDHRLPIRSPPYPPPPLLRLPFKKTLVAFLGTTFLVFFLWAFIFSEAPIQLLNDPLGDDMRRSSDDDSFLFPLYPKSGVGTARPLVVAEEVKLGSMKNRAGDGEEVAGLRRISKNPINSSTVLPLRGNVFPDGQYYTSISVGNPPRPYFLDVDTGSDLTWIQCDAPCSSCAKGPHPLYKPARGNVVPPKDSLCLEVQNNQNFGYCKSCQQCDYEIEYADHSSSLGVLARDELQLTVANGDSIKLSFAFGCAYDQQGHLLASPAKTDGILGLSSAKVSLPSQLASQGVIKNVVGHCIGSGTYDGGYMFLGDDFVPRFGITWIPSLIGVINSYRAEFLALAYGSQKLIVGRQGGNEGQVVFDTGSTYTYFTNEAYTNLITSLNSVSQDLVRDNSDPTLPICWRTDFPVRSVKDVKQYFEPIILQFENRWLIRSTTFTFPPESYLMINNKGNVCLGVLDGSEVLDNGPTVLLGDISLRGKLVVYDNVQQKIGWVQSDCAKPHKPKDFPFFF